MSDENHWTVITLKEYFDSLREADQLATRTALDAAKEAVTAALTAAEKAVDKAEKAATDRADSANHTKDALAEAQATFLTRAEWTASVRAFVIALGVAAALAGAVIAAIR